MSENNNTYDFIIVGGGVAGMTAALYAGRYKLNTMVFMTSYGAISEAHKICNYPGIKEISGMDLISNMHKQVKDLGVPIKFENIVDIQVLNKDVLVVNTEKESIKTKKVLLAIGKEKKKLNATGEDKFSGKGVHYCATCDGNFYKNKIVGVVGGSDAAVTAAIELAHIAKKVYLMYRKDKLRAEPMWIDSLKKQNNVEVMYNTEIEEFLGSDKLEKVKTKDGSEIIIDGVFIEIGSMPNTDFLNKIGVSLDDRDQVIVDKNQKTNLYGIFAAGDMTNHSDLKQIVTASSQGAIAAYNVFKDIKIS
jgi:thioredoxin reductase (NADPH)